MSSLCVSDLLYTHSPCDLCETCGEGAWDEDAITTVDDLMVCAIHTTLGDLYHNYISLVSMFHVAHTYKLQINLKHFLNELLKD